MQKVKALFERLVIGVSIVVTALIMLVFGKRRHDKGEEDKRPNGG